jgi:hypothetical protein
LSKDHPLLLIPSIDLRGGHCVRLLKGDFAAETRYQYAPHELLSRYRPRSASSRCRSAAAYASTATSMSCSRAGWRAW